MRLALVLILTATAFAENWPQWRGPRRDGTSLEKAPPLTWSATENIAWKIDLPSGSGATPIIWGERIFVPVQAGGGHELWCVNRKDGAVMWKRPIGPDAARYRKGNSASNSPVTDGVHVWQMIGSGVLKAFKIDGTEVWARDLQKEYGKFGQNHGYSNSPLLLDGALYVVVLHGMHTDDPSYAMKIDAKTGKTLWKVERPNEAIHESPDSYITPTVVTVNGKQELVISGADVLTGHDLATGKELWRAKGFNPDNNPAYRVVASPVAFGDSVLAPTRVRPMMMYRGGGKGDVTESHRLWSTRNGPDVPTPVSDGTNFFVVQDNGVLWCMNAKSGDIVWGPQRLKPGTHSASPVLAAGRVYAINEDGLTSVFAAGPEFKLLAENMLDDYTLGSPAISEGQIFIRTTKYLWCVGKK